MRMKSDTLQDLSGVGGLRGAELAALPGKVSQRIFTVERTNQAQEFSV